MKRALENVTESFQKQLRDHQEAVAKLENELTQRRELMIKLQGALEGFDILNNESMKPENLPHIQLDDEDEEIPVEEIIDEE